MFVVSIIFVWCHPPSPPNPYLSNVAIFQPVSKGDVIFEKYWEMLGEILFLIKIWSCGAKEMIENIGKDLSPSFPWGNWDQNIARNMSSWRRLEVQSIIQVWFTELSTSRSLLIFLFIFLEEQAHISKRRSWRVFWETRKWGDERGGIWLTIRWIGDDGEEEGGDV